MLRRQRLAFLGLALVVLVIVGYRTTGSLAFALDDFWFTAGLLLLVLLSLVDQPHFSTDANLFMNAVTGWVALLLVENSARDAIWYLFLVWTSWLLVSSYSLMWLRNKPLDEEISTVQLISRINREIGRPEALFSAFFLWGAMAQFGPQSEEMRPLLMFWVVFMILNLPAVARAISSATRRAIQEPHVGVLSGLIAPRVAQIEVEQSAGSLVGKELEIVTKGGEPAAEGRVVADRVGDRIRRATLVLTSTNQTWSKIASARRSTYYVRHAQGVPLDDELEPVGYVGAGSTLSELVFDLDPRIELSEGEVVWVNRPGSGRAYYQIVRARVQETNLAAGSPAQVIQVVAAQLGVWNREQCRFEPITWVAPPGRVIFRLPPSREVDAEIPDGQCEVGSVPNSKFPVHVNVEEVVTHNTALIGVTGSGKSYLAFHLVETMLERGLRVMVLDPSRQHWVYLQDSNPTALRTASDVGDWLDGNSRLGIHQFALDASGPQVTEQFVRQVFNQFAQGTILRAGRNEPAQLCIVFEEAHSLIPEWNQVIDQQDKDRVNRIARLVLQGRKYGLGCCVITQRTANVTKTILNQCNTIFALQSFDQTGLDFLKNYMGNAYAEAMAMLPARHAILVGKASSSARPVLFSIEDFSGRWGAENPEDDGEH